MGDRHLKDSSSNERFNDKQEVLTSDDSSLEKERGGFGNARLDVPGNGAGMEHKNESARDDGKIELTENDCYEQMGINWPSWKKWTVLSVIFAVQVSMVSIAPCTTSSARITRNHH